MSTVLPTENRKEIMAATRARIILVGTLAASLSACVAILSLVPALLTVEVPLMTEDISSGAEKDQKALYEENRKVAAKVRTMLSVLAPFSEEKPSIQRLIARVYELTPEGVYIERIQYQSGKEGNITLTGTSEAREPVNDFRTALVSEGVFESVSVPVAALVGALDGRFTMTLSGKF